MSVEASQLGYAGASVLIDTLPVGNGFDPKLGLVYSSSQSEVTLAGIGWNLTGLSSISRCASQKVFDGVDKAIDWSDTDSFCLDGKKLLRIKDGEFRLYSDEQKKILKVADHFEIFTKAGEHLFFGSKEQSREAGLKGAFFSYFLDKVLDRSGNAIEFTYEKDGERLFIKNIAYGGNDFFSKPHYRNVSFAYEKSATSVRKFIAGKKFEADRLLKEVKVSGVDGGGWSYRLHHEQKGPALLPLLVGIDQCFKDLACIPKTTFEYDFTQDIQLKDAPALQWTNYAPKKYPKWASDQSARTFVDLNNDGFLDLLALRKDSISYSLSGPSGPGSPVEIVRSDLVKWSPLVDMFAVLDMNRDGYSDIVLFTQYSANPGIYVAYWNGNGFDPLVQVSKTFGEGWAIRSNVRAVLDVNNDGWPDVVGIRNEGIFLALNDQHGNLVGGEKVLQRYYRTNDGWTNSTTPRYFVDINGDGLIDVVGFGEKNVEVSLGTGADFLPPQIWSTEFTLAKYNPNTMIRQLADVNSDGLLDIVAMGMNGVDVALNTGIGFGPSERWLDNLGLVQGWDLLLKERFVLDVNRDGIADFVGFSKAGAEVYLGTGKPNRDQQPIKTKKFGDLIYAWDNRTDQMHIEDLDGNGQTDLFVSMSEGIWKAEFNATAVKLVGVKTAMGEATNIGYSSLMDPSLYRRTKDKGQDLIPVMGSMPFVSEIKKSNGVGGFFSTRFTYENAFAHRDFLGFLGFEKRTIFDDTAGTETVETYSQDVSSWTQGALILHETYGNKKGRTLISSTKSNFAALQLGLSKLHRAVLEASSLSNFYDEQGKFSYSVSTRKEYDEFQNAILVETVTTDPYGTYTTHLDSSFVNDVDKWSIGLVSRIQNTSTASSSSEKIVKTTAFEYDNDGRLFSQTEEPDSSLWIKKQYQRTHNTYGLVDATVTSWGPEHGKGLGFTSVAGTLEYDGRGFPNKIYNALSQVSSQTVMPESGLIQSTTDLNGLSTIYTYDPANRVSSVQRPDGQIITVERLACDAACPTNAVMIEKTSSKGFGQSVSYIDNLGRTIRSVKTLIGQRKVVQDQVYSDNGQLIKTSKPYFLGEEAKNWTLFNYDQRNRLSLVAFPDGSTNETIYNGLQSTNIDAMGHKTVYEKDSRGLVRSVTNAKLETISYVYDPAGNLRELHSAGNVTLMQYDIYGRRTNLTDPATGTSTTTYNAFGLPASTGKQGIVTESSFDELGRTLKKIASGVGSASITESFTYDDSKFGMGKLSHAEGPSSSVVYTYDQLARPITKSEVLLGKSYTSRTQYDALGRISQSIYPSDFAVSYTYDEVSQLTEIRDKNSTRAYWSVGDLYPNGDVREYRLGNGARGFKTVDLRNDSLQSETVVGTDQLLQMARSYERDAIGNLLSRKDNTSGVLESFTYDPLDRLETFTGASLKPVKMTYDQLSRITSRSDVGSYEYGKSCGTGIDSPFALKKAGSKSYCTDARGNIIQSGTRTIAYDANNLPTEIKDGQKLVRYQYGLGKSILSKEETINGEKTLTRYVGGNYEIEESAGTVKERHYVSDFLVVEMEGSDYRENYLYKDFLGSTLATADQSGSVIEKLDYDPFGQRRNTTNLSWLDGFKPKTTSRGFTGHDHADSVNLIHMKGRMYDPEIGLFLSPDSYVQDLTLVQNLNRYSYVLNNPLNYTDPSGHFFKHALRELGRGINSAGRAIANPGRFLESTWNKSYRATNDPRYQRLAASVAISVLATIYAPSSASSAWYQTAAYYSAVGYTSSYVATNGDKKAALNGALSGAAFNMVGSYFEYAKQGGQLSTGMMAGKIAAHGVVGGLSAVANGGKFEAGFLAAGLSESAGQAGLYDIGQVKSSAALEISRSAAISAIIGGSISEMSGGSFEQGALTAAMGRLFNATAHSSIVATAAEEIGLAVRGFITTAAEWLTGAEVAAAGAATSVGVVAWTALHSDEIGAEEGGVPVEREPSRPGKMQQEVAKGSAPPSVERVDKGRGPYEQDHIHFDDKNQSALNVDGTWKHGGKELTSREESWVIKHGWSLPKK